MYEYRKVANFRITNEEENDSVKNIRHCSGCIFQTKRPTKAIELNISGWVRNCEDGSVELEAEGEETGMKEFIEWCHRGPMRAVVSKVEIKTIGTKNHSGFEIRR